MYPLLNPLLYHCVFQANHGGVKGKLPSKSASKQGSTGEKGDSDDDREEEEGNEEEEELNKSDNDDEVGAPFFSQSFVGVELWSLRCGASICSSVHRAAALLSGVKQC